MRIHLASPGFAVSLTPLLLSALPAPGNAQSSAIVSKRNSMSPSRLMVNDLFGRSTTRAVGSTLFPFGQTPRFGPDLLQTLGVGARGAAMGSAFTAIANDSTATFWNPARLNVVDRNQFDLEFRSVTQNNATSTQRQVGTATDGSPLFAASAPSSASKVLDPQLSFVGLAVPLTFVVRPVRYDAQHRPLRDQAGNIVRERGTKLSYGKIGFSYALGGYANIDSISVATTNTTDVQNNPVLLKNRDERKLLVRNSVFTLAYANQSIIKSSARSRHAMRGNLGMGAGVFFVNEDQTRTQSLTITNQTPNGATISQTSAPTQTIQSHGSGTGFLIGATYTPQFQKGDRKQWVDGFYTLAFSYRSGPGIDYGGNDKIGPTFNTELPDRLALALGYQAPVRGTKDNVVFDTELQRFSAANPNSTLDHRHEALNFHFGGEYVPRGLDLNARYRLPIRFGYRTVANANRLLFRYDNAITLGLGYQQLRKDSNPFYTVETALEYLTGSHLLQYTFTGRLRF